MKNHSSFLLFAGITLFISCTSGRTNEDKLGEVRFDITVTEKARPLFEKGFLLLHSFEYNDAEEAFREAQKIDPECVMAYWGEAMTYNHPLWGEQDYEKGKEVLMRLAKTSPERIGKAETEIEKDFLSSLEILYGEGTKTERDQAYTNRMRELYEKYPGHHEIASFYALSLLGSVTVGRNNEVYQQSAQIVEKILAENPKHPGALHYMIHANDDPSYAAKGLQAANSYSLVAPDAAHALHMPSHIFVALGMWDESVRSNEASWQASVDRKNIKKLNNDAYGYHSFHWLLYGYLQQGKLAQAQKLVTDMFRYCDELPSVRARTHKIFLQSTYLAETKEYGSELALKTTDLLGLNVATRAMYRFVQGMNAFHSENTKNLKEIISTMESDRTTESSKINSDGIVMCSSGGASRENTTQLDLDVAHIMEMELRAYLSLLMQDHASAEKLLKEATQLENNTSYSYGPPSVVKPSHELYGEFLLEANRSPEALELFNASLKRAPNRVCSLQGKLKAAKMLKNEDLAKEIETKLQRILKESGS